MSYEGSEHTHADNEMLNDVFVNLLMDMIIQSNVESRQHLVRVSKYSEVIAKYYAKIFPRAKMTQKKQTLIVQAALIHDVGKMMIPDVLNDRAGLMSQYEFELYKKHTIKGSQIIRSMSFNRDRDFERICYNVCLYHHEKYDGKGYPYGIRENKIPLEAQIVGLADIYDTLLHMRNHEGYNKRKAFYMILSGECGAISPKLLECFEEAKNDLEQIEI